MSLTHSDWRSLKTPNLSIFNTLLFIPSSLLTTLPPRPRMAIVVPEYLTALFRISIFYPSLLIWTSCTFYFCIKNHVIFPQFSHTQIINFFLPHTINPIHNTKSIFTFTFSSLKLLNKKPTYLFSISLHTFWKYNNLNSGQLSQLFN